MVTNVAEEESVKALAKAVVDKFQRIDYAVNCAGITGGSQFVDTKLADVSCSRSYLATSCCLRQLPLIPVRPRHERQLPWRAHLRARGARRHAQAGALAWVSQDFACTSDPSAKPGREQRGAIVTIASVLGKRSIPYATPYITAKHAVVGFTKTAAQEVAPKKVRV